MGVALTMPDVGDSHVMGSAREGKLMEEIPKSLVKAPHEVKLREMLRNITSVEIELCSEASKIFIKLLRSESGGELLNQYVKASPKCSELNEAWKFRREKPGMFYIVSLVAAILSHPDGKYKANCAGNISTSKELDKFAQSIIEDKLEDVYKELSSKEAKRQNAALLLMASIVRRGSGLASEVAKRFDFKLSAFSRLAYCKRKQSERKMKYLTREAFVGFAVSFLEVGKPGLLRWILQQKEMYYRVLCGLENDNDQTVSHVLSTLRDRVLNEKSLVPPPLRSVLFGNVTLEQLVNICWRESSTAELAHSVLVMVCTDPCNGIMPDENRQPTPMRGNPKRLLCLMKKLRATEVDYHKDLLLAIVNGKPHLAAAYMDEFPYSLEDLKSTTWFSSVSLAANLISSVRTSLPVGFLDFPSHDALSLDSSPVQYIMKCACPRSFNRSVINKGLLHSDLLLKHGTLRLLLESLSLWDSFMSAIKCSSCIGDLHGVVSLKQEIQDTAQLSLPAPQVLLTLVSSLSARCKGSLLGLKRAADLKHNKIGRKKFKSSEVNEAADIIVGGLCSVREPSLPEDSEGLGGAPAATSDIDDFTKVATELWQLNGCSMAVNGLKDVEILLYSKLLDAVKLYHRIVPGLFEGSFDFFKILPENPMTSPVILQQSILSLFTDHIGWCPNRGIPTRAAPLMYKHLRPFIELLLYSPMKDIRDQADTLARAAMLSTGAFEKKSWEIGFWFYFLPGYSSDAVSVEDKGVEAFKNMASVVISFLCDAVSSVGNNLFRYWDRVRHFAHQLKRTEDVTSSDFSPLAICALEKCLRLLSSESGKYTQAEKSTISSYMSNTLGYILQTQVQDGLLSSLVSLLLLEKFEGNSCLYDDCRDKCEWWLLKNLLLFSEGIKQEETCSIFTPGFEPLLDVNCDDDNTSSMSTSCLFPKSTDFKSVLMDPESVAASVFLKGTPFYILFPGLLNIFGRDLLGCSKVLDLLLAKLRDLRCGHFISSLVLVLFSITQIQTSYRTKPSGLLEKLSEACHVIVDNMLKKLQDSCLDPACSTISGAYLSGQEFLDLSKILLTHPAVIMPVVYSPCLGEELIGKSFLDFENLFNLCGQRVCRVDLFALNLLKNVFDCLLTLCHGQKTASGIDDCAKEWILKAMNLILQKIILRFQDSFDICMKNKEVVPLVGPLYCLYIFIHYISPFRLLKLAEWMFIRVDREDFAALKSVHDSVLLVGLFIASRALEILSCYAHQPNLETVPYDCLWELKDTISYVALFERIYFKACELSLHLKLDLADLCLLRAVDFLHKQKLWQQQTRFLHLNMVALRVIMSTPLEILYKCICKTSMTRAELLFILVERSPLHKSIFGQLFTSILNGRFIETSNNNLSDEDSLMLLPAAVSFMNSNILEFGKLFYNHSRRVSSYYSRILFDGFVDWKSFVSRSIFQIDASKFLPSSTEEILRVINDSLLGKAAQMLRHHLFFSADILNLKTQLRLFNSICALVAHDDLLEYDIGEIGSYTLGQSLGFVNRAVAKISICRMLLFLENNETGSSKKEAEAHEQAVSLKNGSKKEMLSRVRLINILMHAWQLIVKKFPSVSNVSQAESGTNVFFKFLEVHILTTIIEIVPKMSDGPPLENLAKSSLLHRFEDPTTMKMLHTLLVCFSECKPSHAFILQLLLAHSQFVSAIHSVSRPSVCSPVGPLFKPMASILGSLSNPFTDSSNEHSEVSVHETKQLEVIKLLRRLCCSNTDSVLDLGVDLKELLFLLLSSYGATLGEVDLEIYELMHEIELSRRLDLGSITEMGYLWGSSTVKLKNDSVQELGAINDAEAIREHRRRQFREYLPIDPKMCAATVLYFPYDRTIDNGPSIWKKINSFESEYVTAKRKTQYDPVFILRFSIHSLSMGHLEPFEFASLGLLAIVFLSISSHCEGIRKLGYEALGRFKNALEKYRRKDLMRMRLLLTYLQNGIEKPWQQIPSFSAIFAAEASVLLLDPSHGHYSTISKLLMDSPKVNFKCVPLFHDFFWSGSMDFKAGRLWILRLLYASINYDHDAQICIRDSIFEMLLSFYSTPLADNVSKELILLIVEKSVKLHRMARYLVERCGLLSWLSSILSCFVGGPCLDQNKFSSIELALTLQVVSNLIASKNIIMWLKDHAFEQLSEFASHLYKLLVGGLQFMKNRFIVVNASLRILVSILKISQEREIYQPHFTLSLDGLFQMLEAIDASENGRWTPAAELSLRAILVSTPSPDILQMDQKKLSKFITLSMSIALQSESASEGKQHHEDSLSSKLLRWLAASIILGSLSWKSGDFDHCSVGRPRFETLKSYLCYIKKGYGEIKESGFDCDGILAKAVLYLQGFIGLKCCFLPSVVGGLLLFLGAFRAAGAELSGENDDDDVRALLLSRIRSPAEANCFWRWSFEEAWEDPLVKKTEKEKLEELQACRSLLLVFSNLLGEEVPAGRLFLWAEDVEGCGAFKWERSLLETL